jgi:CRISPR/Cas system-associated protein endoribonuclease Cas2
MPLLVLLSLCYRIALHYRIRCASLLSALVLHRCSGNTTIDGLSESDQTAVAAIMADLDMKQTQKMFANLTEVAFNECVTNFRGRTLEKSEAKCVENMVRREATRGCK